MLLLGCNKTGNHERASFGVEMLKDEPDCDAGAWPSYIKSSLIEPLTNSVYDTLGAASDVWTLHPARLHRHFRILLEDGNMRQRNEGALWSLYF